MSKEGGVGFNQCQRKSLIEIEGYKFCSFHAKEINEAYGIADVIGKRYVAKFNGSEDPDLAEFDFTSETDKFINVSNVKNIVGHVSFYTGKQKKDDRYNRQFSFFDTEQEAWLWLYEKPEEHWKRCQENLDKSLTQLDKMSNLLQNQVWNNHK